MDHSNPGGQESHSHRQCHHRRCLHHAPEMVDHGDVRHEPNHAFFGLITTYLTARCCGESMARVKKVQTKRCKKCGRVEDFVYLYLVALCRCCGRTRKMNFAFLFFEGGE